jgi:hypothetical protein
MLSRGSSGGAGAPPAGGRTLVPVEQIVADIAAMGFPPGRVWDVVRRLEAGGQAVDLNVIIDRLTRGG